MRYAPVDKKKVAEDIKTFIRKERNFRNPNLTLAMVAEALGLARSTLIKVLTEEMNTTFRAYVDNCRLRHSRHLVMLNHGRFSMEHIAAVSGYGSVHSFNRKYKAEYGELPRDTKNIDSTNNINKKARSISTLVSSV